MKKLLLVAGARPNFMKIAPIVRELDKHPETFTYRLVHTGQHYDKEMSDVFFEELEIPRPDYCLEVGSGSHAEQTAKVMLRFEKVVEGENPDLVVVVGDVNSTLACALVAKKCHVPVAHVEAGLRSGDRRMPEEINRIVTDTVSDYFFVTEKSGIEHLRAEGKPESAIHFVGHVMIDNLFHQIDKLRRIDRSALSSEALKRLYPNYGVITLHRPSNVDDRKTLGDIVSALGEIAKELPLIFPLHPRTQAKLDTFALDLPAGIITTRPLSYLDFLNLFKDTRLVLTDSGGLQEETTALGVPCLTLRENTERPITVEEGSNVVVGTAPSRIITEAQKILAGQGKTGRRPERWDGHAAARIVQILATC